MGTFGHGTRHVRTALLVALLATFGALPSLAAPGAASGDAPAGGAVEMKASAAAQIRAIYQEKAVRSAGQRKIDSALMLALAKTRRDAWLADVPMLRGAPAPRADGRYLIDLEGRIDGDLLARVEALGGQVDNAHPRYGQARIRLPLQALEALASLQAVRALRTASPMMTQMVISEGDVAHSADTGRTNFGVDGSGVMACAMSDSVDALGDLQTSGELPGTVTVLPGQSGNPGTSEGTALLEIIHDLAPGAELAFATGQGGQAQMAQNILDLAAAGCDVIVDDILYLTEPVFQDGIIAQAVDQVFADGVNYYSSAGNSGNLSSGESGVFEGNYTGTALPAPLAGNGLSAHDFGGGNAGNEITGDPPSIATLQWSDPFGAAGNDYDLFMLDAAMANVLAASTNVQNGDDDPVEALLLNAGDDTGNHLVVLKFAGDDRFINLNTHRGRLDVGTDGQIFGHPAAVSAMTVAAVNVATAGGAPFAGGAANPVEFFSSDGPRRIFFETDGTPVRAAPNLRGGQTSTVRQKPDITAADGVSTTTPGFESFFGTSASAPHSAAMSALFEDLFPGTGPDAINDIFRSSALDIEDPGFDRDTGAGIQMMEPAFENTIFADGFESGDTSAWTE